MTADLGFGFLRLPRLEGGGVDYEAGCALADRFLALGGRYFDTAYTYLEGQSEEAIRRCLAERHPRDAYHLADKLPGFAAKSEADSLRFFETSLRRCGVQYFDTYLLHGLNGENYEIAKKLRQFEFLREIRRQGRAKRIGFSFHGSPELLDRILMEHPEVECVLLQINYLDWHSPALRASALYETARRHGRAILIMEPVKGGSLATPPVELGLPGNPAGWAIRFAAGLPGVETVLSGMNTLSQIEENLRPHLPLSSAELEQLEDAAARIRAITAAPCTACGYCLPGCPVGLPIPQYLALYNEYARNPGENWKMEHIYFDLARRFAPASSCIHCGACIKSCPQCLDIPGFLSKAAAGFPAE